MDLPALLYTLQQRRLFFQAINRMKDPYDGDVPEHVFRQYRVSLGLPPTAPLPGAISGADVRMAVRKFTGINCWHMNSAESAAMWALYSPNYGVAIRSTIGRLMKSFHVCPAKVSIGAVQYINFDSPKKKEAHLWFSPLFVKRKSFEHERELRAVVIEPRIHKEKLTGVGVGIDIVALIERIFISPLVETWSADVIREEVKLHCPRGVEVTHSSLYDKELG